MRYLPLQQVHGSTASSVGNVQWNERDNELYVSSGSVLNIINVRTSKIIKHIATPHKSIPIQCFILTNDYKYLFTVQHQIQSEHVPLITCIALESNSKYKIKLNDLFKDKHKTLLFTSDVQSVQINEDRLIIFTKYQMYIIKIDFDQIAKLSSKSLLVDTTCVDVSCDVIGYLNTLTEIHDVIFFDLDTFISCGDKHLSIWRYSHMRQKFNFGKFKDKDRQKNNEAMSPTMRQIPFKLGIFANARFVCVTLGDTEEAKERLFVITRQGILCTFDIQGRCLQKWVNLRMDQAFHITMHSSLIVCCGSPDKARIFESNTLRHLGTMDSNAHTSEIEEHVTIVDALMIHDAKKLISVYSNGNIVLWNMIKQESESQYQFNMFRYMERNRFCQPQSMVTIQDSSLIISNEKRCLKYIPNAALSTTLPQNLQMEQNISHVIPLVASQSFLTITDHATAKMYDIHSLEITETIDIRQLIQGTVQDIRVSLSSRFIAVKPVDDNAVHVIDVSKPKHIDCVLHSEQPIIDFDFCSDDNGMLILTSNGVALHSFEAQTRMHIFTEESNSQMNDIKGIKVYPGGKFMIVFLKKSPNIFVWNIEQKCVSRSYPLPDIAHQIVFDSTGLYLVAACNDNNIYFIDWFSGKPVYTGAFHVSPIVDMMFCADLDCVSLITVSSDGLIAKWTLPTKIKTAIQERQRELNGTHSIILNSFNDLKQIQLQLPGGFAIDDLLSLNEGNTDDIVKQTNETHQDSPPRLVIDDLLGLNDGVSDDKAKTFQENEPIFIEQNGWKKENITQYLKEENDTLSSSVVSSIEIPSLQSLNTEQKQNVDSDHEQINEIMQQLQILERNQILHNTKDLIDIEIVVDGDDNHDNINNNAFPIRLTIRIDSTKANKDVERMKEELDESKDETEEISLLYNCFETSLQNVANSLEQIHSLRLLLQMKQVSTQDIVERMQTNERLKQSLESVAAHSVLQMIKMIDANGQGE
eukprot:150227_1